MKNSKGGKNPKQTPFFSRYLEGQESLEPKASVRIVGPKQLAYKQSKSAPLQTLKFPSDQDELNFCFHYGSKEEVPAEYGGGGKVVTLKFPSDNDEDFWQAEYVDQADIPRGRRVKPKEAKVNLKKARKK